MLTLADIDNYQMRGKIQKIQTIIPWASVMLCRSALLQSKGVVNGACFILSESDIDLSDDEDIVPKHEEGLHKISESSKAPSYELNQAAAGLPEVLLQPTVSACNSEAGPVRMFEILLPGNTVLEDLRKTGLVLSKAPTDTKLSVFDRRGLNTSIFGPTCDHQGNSNIEEKLCDTKHKRGETRKVNTSWALQSSRTNKRDALGDMGAGPSPIGGTMVRTTRSMIRGNLPATQHASGGFSWADGGDNQRFHRNERSTEDKQRMEFTAAAVIRAVCAPAKSLSLGGENCGYHEVSPYGDIVFVESYFKVFTMSHGRFDKWQGSKPVNDGTYTGTNRGPFIPSPWMDAQDSGKRGFLQTINIQGQYKKFSLEELRLGDYVRGRTKAPHLFSLFRKLPAELRLMVWKFARAPRVVELRYNTLLTRCWTPCAPPALLRVCQESRSETLRSCQPSFGLTGWAPRIYFDAEIDTLYLNFERNSAGTWDSTYQVVENIDNLEMHDSHDLRKVKSLAIDQVLWDFWNEVLMEEEEEFLNHGNEDDEFPVLECLPVFTRLRELKIVQTEVVGFWKQVDRSGNEWGEEDFVDEDIEFVSLSRSQFRHGGGNVSCGCVLKRLKANDQEWSLPVMGYLKKVLKR